MVGETKATLTVVRVKVKSVLIYSNIETKATLTVVRAKVKSVFINSNIENTTLCSLPWTQVGIGWLLACLLNVPATG